MGEGDRGAGSLHFLRPGLGREVAATGGGGDREEAKARLHPENRKAPLHFTRLGTETDKPSFGTPHQPPHPTRSKKRRATPRKGCPPLLYRHIRPPPGSGPGAEKGPRDRCGPKHRKAPKVPLRLVALKGTRRDRCGPERRGPESKAEPGRGPRPRPRPRP